MEPRARAGKNVGKETFNAKEVRNLLYAYGDVKDPLQETVRVLDEIVTEFLEGVCFEASRHAQVAGRQKLKFDDFEFALRNNPQYLGRVKSMIEKRQKIKEMRRTFDQEDDALAKEHGKENAAAAARVDDDDLDDLDDEDEDLEVRHATASKAGSPQIKMRTTRTILVALAACITGTTALPQTPDPSVVFFAELFSTVSDCSATSGVKAFLYSLGECQNTAIPSTGSAHVRFNERPETLSLTGWTGANCTGDKVAVGSEVGVCVSLDGVDVASWSY
ncbi:hypothetical protein M426DRAFT_11202 [Hypoxylon sp. CI-4A]|nr:hypothetical protein M426DRAFT_11202 [Hypoxylon sp. CI-4A]